MAGVVVGGIVVGAVVAVANAIVVADAIADAVGSPDPTMAATAAIAAPAADDEDIIVVAAGVGSVRLRWSIFGRMMAALAVCCLLLGVCWLPARVFPSFCK